MVRSQERANLIRVGEGTATCKSSSFQSESEVRTILEPTARQKRTRRCQFWAMLFKIGNRAMQELLVSSLATADALTKLLIAKGLITQTEFMQKLSAERAGYQAMLQKVS